MILIIKIDGNQNEGSLKIHQNSTNLYFLQKKKFNEKTLKKEKKKELILQQQKFFDLYNSKKSADLASNASSSNSFSANSTNNQTYANPNTSINSLSENEALKRGAQLFFSQKSECNLNKAKKLKSNLINRFNENTEEEKELMILNSSNNFNKPHEKVKHFIYYQL